MGGVPKTIRFDNLSAAVKKVLPNGERQLTEEFQNFVLHYGFEYEFCNPNSGNEKGTLNKLFKQIEKLDLLILDELGYIPLHKQGAELLFQIISMCYETKSIIITTNLQFGQWNHVFGNPILTEAVFARLIHHSHLIVFNGDSHRYKESVTPN